MSLNTETLDLRKLPRSEFTYELCLALVTKNGLNISYVPCNIRSQEICVAAITQNKEAAKLLLENELEFVKHLL